MTLSEAFLSETSYEGYSPAGALRETCMKVEDVEVYGLIVALETSMAWCVKEYRIECQKKLDAIAKQYNITNFTKPDF